jgi:phage baseplate assembly protein gpV
VEDLLVQLAQRVQNKYFGKYRGFVVDNQDPRHLARLRLRVPSVLGATELDWALPCLPFGGLADQGLFTVPEVGAQVWVEFEEGELSAPIWTGTFWQTADDVPEEAALDEPTTRLLKTPSGHRLQFDDAEGEERVVLHHTSGAELSIDENGTVVLTDAAGATLTLDADAEEVVVADAGGNTLSMTSSGVTLEDANGNKIEMASSGIKITGDTIEIG